MKIFFLRLFFLFAAVLFAHSFLSLALPWGFGVFWFIAFAVAWAIILGFPRALGMTLALAALGDLVSRGTPGALTLYSVPLVYGVSFLARRLHIERRRSALPLYGALTSFASLAFLFFEALFFSGGSLGFERGAWLGLLGVLADQSWVRWGLLLAGGGIMFSVVYLITARFERYLNTLAQSEFRRLQ